MSDPSFLTNTSPGLERAWYAVATSDEITEQPRAVQLLGRHWCVLRLDGQLTAFEDRCPHRLAPLSIGTNCGAVLECRYHGWRFDRTGACTLIPSLGPDAAIPPRATVAVPYGVVERYGLVWLAPAAPVCELPAPDEWDDPAYDTCRNEPSQVACSAFQLTDNFLDATHLPTVHTQTFGVADAGYLPPHEVAADGWRISTWYRVTYRNHDDPLVATWRAPTRPTAGPLQGGEPGLHRADPPRHAAHRQRLAILFALQPQHDDSSRVYKQMARNDFAGDEQRIKGMSASRGPGHGRGPGRAGGVPGWACPSTCAPRCTPAPTSCPWPTGIRPPRRSAARRYHVSRSLLDREPRWALTSWSGRGAGPSPSSASSCWL
ncbi:MAG: Rieske 2Fe-2S domain-containing protein [Acidimicrobiales bacterium]